MAEHLGKLDRGDNLELIERARLGVAVGPPSPELRGVTEPITLPMVCLLYTSIRRVADRAPGRVTEVLLVLDATTGQNAVVQARQFTEAVGVTGVVLTKLDGTAKGGVVIPIERQLGLPVKLVGVGEGPDDMIPFDPESFVDALVGL